MNIPERAVEAAANAMVNASPDLSGWEDLNEAEVDWYMRDAREALEAAAPYLYAQALREHRDWILSENYIDQDLSVRECVIDLDARADELDPHE